MKCFHCIKVSEDEDDYQENDEDVEEVPKINSEDVKDALNGLDNGTAK